VLSFLPPTKPDSDPNSILNPDLIQVHDKGLGYFWIRI
jgi:hypothetical protein